MKTPLISVIIPVFNGEQFIATALDSLLTQEHNAFDIIVVNDGSSDASSQVATKWAEAKLPLGSSFQVIEQENSGPGQARNRGIEAARGDYIAFLDADDLWAPQSLKTRLEKLESSDYIAVLGLTRAFLTKNGEIEFFGDAFRYMNVGAGLFNKNAFEINGNFSASMRGSEDVDWFLRARDSGLKLLAFDSVTLWYRRHENNLTKGQSLADLDFHVALKRSLDRRRNAKIGDTSAPFALNNSVVSESKEAETKKN